jgi:hypothetical protein
MPFACHCPLGDVEDHVSIRAGVGDLAPGAGSAVDVEGGEGAGVVGVAGMFAGADGLDAFATTNPVTVRSNRKKKNLYLTLSSILVHYRTS